MEPIRTAVILAAGRGTRLNPLTGDQVPKPLLPFQGRPLLEWSIQALHQAGVERVLIGTGHLASTLHEWRQGWVQGQEWAARKPDEIRKDDEPRKAPPEITFVHNPDYATTGSILTLLRFKDIVREPFLLLESDLLYSPSGLQGFVERTTTRPRQEGVEGSTSAGRVDPTPRSWMLATGPLPIDDNVFVQVHPTDGRFARCDKHLPESLRVQVLTGIWALEAGILPKLDALMSQRALSPGLDYETVLGVYSENVSPIGVDLSHGFIWTEIDSPTHHTFATQQVWPRIREEYTSE